MMAERKLKWGILGAARVNQRLLPAIMEAPNSQLVAIASRREGAAKAVYEQYASVPNYSEVTFYDDLENLFADANVEAIYCPMANEEHAEWAMKAIKAGKHVLIEKPMATSLVDVIKMEFAAKDYGVKVMEGFMYRFHPQHAKLHDMINTGLIGDVLSARASFSFLMKPSRMYRVDRSMANGGGALWDIGPLCDSCFALVFSTRRPASKSASRCCPCQIEYAWCRYGDQRGIRFWQRYERARAFWSF